MTRISATDYAHSLLLKFQTVTFVPVIQFVPVVFPVLVVMI